MVVAGGRDASMEREVAPFGLTLRPERKKYRASSERIVRVLVLVLGIYVSYALRWMRRASTSTMPIDFVAGGGLSIDEAHVELRESGASVWMQCSPRQL